MKRKVNPVALLPIFVFLALYLGLGIVFEYIMKIPMGFYNIPIIVAFLVAILTACLQNREVSFDEKLEIMAQGMADKNIITMLLIFLTAGVFVGVVGRDSAESVAYFMLQLIPARFIKRFGMTSEEFATRLLREEKIAIVPGTAFGDCGEGYLRVSYAYSMEDLKRAIRRIRRFVVRLDAVGR